MKTIEIRVTGKVQGVYYRATAKEKARELGLTGYVQNEKDGSVYILITGHSAAQEDFLDWCRVGPPHAVVENVDVKEVAPQSYYSFEVRK